MKSIIRGKSKRFSLLEILLVVGIAVILLGILIPVLKRGNDKAKEVACINNLRNLSLAIQIYKNEFGAYPRGDLSSALYTYLPEGQGIYACPTSGNIYDNYYVAREGSDDGLYIIGCPQHGIVNYTPGKGTRTFQMGRILNNGQVVAAGSVVKNGKLEFEDGSTADVKGTATVVTSFRTLTGQLYTILRILDANGNSQVNVEVDVTPGSKFEVVTPAAIAGVAGTHFILTVDRDANDMRTTDVSVTKGTVQLVGRKGAPDSAAIMVVAGGHAQKIASAAQCQQDPPADTTVAP